MFFLGFISGMLLSIFIISAVFHYYAWKDKIEKRIEKKYWKQLKENEK